MGYVPPPSGVIVLPEGITVQQFGGISEGLRAIYGAYSHPQMTVRTHIPRSYAEYRQSLYGDPPHDWMPFLNVALLGSMITLVAAILWVLL